MESRINIGGRREDILIDILILSGIVLFILQYFNVRLITLDTTITGGDLSSFPYFTKYYGQVLASGRLGGWAPGWFAGFPILQFYFPLLFIFILGLAAIMPFNIAFKVILTLTVVGLPAAAYVSFRLIGFKFPTPALAAVLTLPLLFNENYKILGGNISSVLTGIFAYGFGIIWLLVYMGSYPTGMKKEKGWLSNSVLIAFCVLSSSFTALFSAMLTLLYIPSGDSKRLAKNIVYAVKVGTLGFFLTAWWSLPLVFKKQWAAVSSLARHDTADFILDYIPWGFAPIYALGLIGIIKAVKDRDSRMAYIGIPLVLSCLLFVFLPQTPVISDYTYNGRYISMMYLTSLTLCAYGIAVISRRFSISYFAPFIALIIIAYVISGNVSFTQAWIKGNLEGYENKPGWTAYMQAMDTLSAQPGNARVMYEHSPRHATIAGSSRAFESVPYFSSKPGLEGTVFESSVSSVFVVTVLQAEISLQPSCPLRGYRCPPMNFTNAAFHSKAFNVKHLILTSDKAKKMAEDSGMYRLVRSVPIFGLGSIGIYEVLSHGGNYVEVPENEPVIVVTDDWHSVSLKWFKNTSLLNTPLILTKDESLAAELNLEQVPQSLENLPHKPLPTNCIIDETVEDERIKFTTNCIGVPHIIKNSYFPNWEAYGAKGPYLVSPAMMMVIPTGQEVTLEYRMDALDYSGLFLTVLGLGIFAISVSGSIRAFRPYQRRFLNSLPEWIASDNMMVMGLTSVLEAIAFKVTKIKIFMLRVSDLPIKHRAILFLLVVIIIGSVYYIQNRSECQTICSESYAMDGSVSLGGRLVDIYDMGNANKFQNIAHELICDSGCDESRPDLIFTGWAKDLRFKMDFDQTADNELVFRLNDNHDCRSMGVYVNGQWIGYISNNGEPRGLYSTWKDFRLRVPKSALIGNRGIVRIVKGEDPCTGWDIDWVESRVTKCQCH